MERKAPKQVRQHHWLVAGEITFSMKQEDGSFEQHLAKQNCVVFSTENRIRVQELGKAQQTLQMQLFSKMGSDKAMLENIEVTNVVILGFIYCGHMTQAEFNEAPQGLIVQEKGTSELDKLLAIA
jgi:hypothetical protein